MVGLECDGRRVRPITCLVLPFQTLTMGSLPDRYTGEIQRFRKWSLMVNKCNTSYPIGIKALVYLIEIQGVLCSCCSVQGFFFYNQELCNSPPSHDAGCGLGVHIPRVFLLTCVPFCLCGQLTPYEVAVKWFCEELFAFVGSREMGERVLRYSNKVQLTGADWPSQQEEG